MSPRHGLKKILAPELQTDGCFATGVTHQTLLKPKENVQFQLWFFENFLGATPPEPHTGEGLQRPSPDPTHSELRRFAPPRLARDLRVRPLTKILATRLPTCWPLVVVMEFGKRHDATETIDFCPRQLVTDLSFTVCCGLVAVKPLR